MKTDFQNFMRTYFALTTIDQAGGLMHKCCLQNVQQYYVQSSRVTRHYRRGYLGHV